MVISIKLYLTVRNLTPFIRIGSYRPTLYLFKMTKPCPFDPPRVFFRPKRNEVPLGTWSMGWTHHGSGAKQSFAVGDCAQGSIDMCLAILVCCQKLSDLQKWIQRCHTDTNHMCYMIFAICTQYTMCWRFVMCQNPQAPLFGMYWII